MFILPFRKTLVGTQFPGKKFFFIYCNRISHPIKKTGAKTFHQHAIFSTTILSSCQFVNQLFFKNSHFVNLSPFCQPPRQLDNFFNHHIIINLQLCQTLFHPFVILPAAILSIKIISTCHFANQWKRINWKQSARYQHLSRLKASAFFSLQKKC
jgi:hypothetical protein